MVLRYDARPSRPTLGRADTVEAFVLDRSLTRTLRPLTWEGNRFTRVLDEVSDVQIDVPYDDQGTLQGLRPWQHGIGVFRNRQLEWSGPVTSIRRSSGKAETIEVNARDRLSWMGRRYPRERFEIEADLAEIFGRLIAEGTRFDNRFGLYSVHVPTGVSAKRSFDIDSRILDALQDLSRSGLEFSVVRDILRAGPVGGLNTEPPLLIHASAFLGEIGVELDGLSQGNRQVTVGGGSGGSNGYTIVAAVDDWSDRIGLLEQVEVEESARDVASAAAASQTRWDSLAETPMILTFPPLSPDFPGTTDDLVPGRVFRLQVDDKLFDLSGDYRLTQITFDHSKSDNGEIDEKIEVEMQRVA